jgi:FlaA1/EpsC-like NDP-sugar epimerase
MKNYIKENNLPGIIILVLDLFVVAGALFFAFLLRFNFQIPTDQLESIPRILLCVIGCHLLSFFITKTYKSIIRYTATKDIIRIFIANGITSLFFILINVVHFNFIDHTYFIPFSIVILEFGISTFVIWFYRMGIKVAYLEFINPTREKQNVIIYGAGDAGLNTKRAIDRDAGLKYKVFAFVDDDPNKKDKKLEGVSIYPASRLDEILTNNIIAHVIIAIQNIHPDNKKDITEKCLSHNVKVLVVPPVSRWINGELSFKQIKKIKIEELLQRDEIKLDPALIIPELVGKTVMITGAAGSIGSEIVRQIAAYNCKRIILVDVAETPLFYLELEIKEKFIDRNFDIHIVDITNKEQMELIFAAHVPDVIYHAAAYKHVPMMEKNPSSAIRNNVYGTKVLADLSMKYGVKKFVMISTDKAVNPTSIMGASKRIAEIYIQSLNQLKKTAFITTRFGNVLGSNGSVIPVFRDQIEKGGPITITHVDITRYFMTIPEACQLVLIAGAIGKGGEIFIFDMGESVKIIDLAKKMIELSGLTLGKDIQIKFTGLRPGEKLYEELLATKENTLPTEHKKIMIAQVRFSEYNEVEPQIQQLLSLVNISETELVMMMKKIIPEYKSNNSEYESLDIQSKVKE